MRVGCFARKIRMLWLLVWALVAAGCGGTPEALPEAERALERRDLEAAERGFRSATRTYLTESERERVRAGLRAVAERRAEPLLQAAQAKPGFAGLEAMAEARKHLHQQGAGRDEKGQPTDADRRLVAAMIARVEALWTGVTAQVQAGHQAGAVGEAERLLAPLGGDRGEALSARLAALRAEAQTFHEARLAAVAAGQGEAIDGARALHAGLVRRFGGQAASPIGALRAAARVQVQTTAAGSGACGEAARQVAKGATSGGQEPATVAFTMTHCEAVSDVTQKQSRYFYTVKVPYQTTETVQVGTRQVVAQRRTCSRDSVSFFEGGKRKVVSTIQYDCSTYTSEPTYATRPVTKYREEQREGVRVERTERNRVRYEGRAAVRWEGGEAVVPVAASLDATDTAWSTPQGSKEIEPAKRLGALKASATDRLQLGIVTGATRAVNASVAARWFGVAEQAQAAGERTRAEDADVRGVVAAGDVNPAVVARLGGPFGLDGPAILAALEGKSATPTTAALALANTDRLDLGNAARADFNNGDEILERGFNIARAEYGLRAFGSVNLPGQPDRSGLGFLMRVAYPLLGQMFDGHTFESRGWVLFDTLMFDLWLGGRTSDPWRYDNGDEEGAFVGGGGAGYQLLAGYRGGSIGLFAGVRTQRFARAAGGFRTAGGSHPFVARLEFTGFDRHPIFVEGYGFKAFGTGEVRGAELLYTLQGTHGLLLRYEATDLDARYNGHTERDVIDLGRQATRTLDVVYVLQF